MLKLTAQYADLWNTGYMGQPETMAAPLAKIEAACRAIGRDPATLGITALIGLWCPDLQATQPRSFDTPWLVRCRRSQQQCVAMPNAACSTSCFNASLTLPKRANG